MIGGGRIAQGDVVQMRGGQTRLHGEDHLAGFLRRGGRGAGEPEHLRDVLAVLRTRVDERCHRPNDPRLSEHGCSAQESCFRERQGRRRVCGNGVHRRGRTGWVGRVLWLRVA